MPPKQDPPLPIVIINKISKCKETLNFIASRDANLPAPWSRDKAHPPVIRPAHFKDENLGTVYLISNVSLERATIR